MKTQPVDGTLYFGHDSRRLAASFIGTGVDLEEDPVLHLEESVAGQIRIWIADDHSVELTREQARPLARLLRRFVDTGHLGATRPGERL